MKYSTSVTINKPIKEAWEFFVDETKTKMWQPTYISSELISGAKGGVNSKNRMKFNNKGKTMEMTETIVERVELTKFTAIYEAKGVYNYNVMMFKEIGLNQTEVIMDSEFKFNGFMKIIGFFFSSAFKKESQKSLNLLKSACEAQS